jgi:hypothetical protein
MFIARTDRARTMAAMKLRVFSFQQKYAMMMYRNENANGTKNITGSLNGDPGKYARGGLTMALTSSQKTDPSTEELLIQDSPTTGIDYHHCKLNLRVFLKVGRSNKPPLLCLQWTINETHKVSSRMTSEGKRT